MAKDVGTGTTIGFGTSSWTAPLMNITGPSMSRESIRTSAMSTTGGHTFIPGDLHDPGEVSITVQHVASVLPPIDAVAETITITWPGLCTWQACGFMVNFGGWTAGIDELITADATIKLSGSVSYTTS